MRVSDEINHCNMINHFALAKQDNSESILQDEIFKAHNRQSNNNDFVITQFLNEPNETSKCVIITTIKEKKYETLIDTGAESCNYITENTVLRLTETIQPCIGVHKAANGSELPISGQVNLNVEINKVVFPINFIVVNGELPYDVILGWKQFVQLYEGIIDSTINSLILKRPEIVKYNVAYVQESYQLPPLSEVIVNSKIRNKQLTGDSILHKYEPLFARLGVCITPGVIYCDSSNQSNEVLISVCNMTAQPITIPALTIIATLESMEIVENIQSKSKEQNAKLLTIHEKQSGGYKESVKIDNPNLTQNEIKQAHQLINQEYADLFDSKKGHGKASKVTHHIETGKEHPVNNTPYRSSIKEREAITQQVQVMLKDGVIRPPKSPWASRVVLVRKKNGKLRFCVDYRKLNNLTKKDVYPLPRIDDSLAALQKGKFFTSFDLSAGYWQIPMEKESIEKTAFITDSGLYEFNVMPFGLSNAPATFQRYMDAITAGLKWKSLLVYLDDIIVFSSTFEEHMNDLKEVLERLRTANLTLNPDKCFIFQNKLSYLGHVVSYEVIETDPRKIKAILSMKTPTNCEDLRTLLGCCGYYRKFIPQFAQLCCPLYKLLHHNVQFKWTEQEDKTFQELKRLLTTTPILKHPDFKYPFQVHTDASDAGLGCTLVQMIDREERVIMYLSRTLQPAERNWTTREKEALAILWACESLRSYLIGYKFEVVTDHESLKWFMAANKPARLLRWAVRLSEFDFTIRHRAGKKHGNADMLSRLVDDKFLPNDEVVAPNLTYDFISSINEIFQLEDVDYNEIYQKQRADNKLKSLIEQCGNSNNFNENQEFTLVDNLLYKVQRNNKYLVIPQELQEKVLKQYHTHNVSAHMARDRLINILTSRFFWEDMRQYIKQYVQTCDMCQRIKTRAPVRNGLLRPIQVSKPFEIVGTDIAIMRTSSGGNRYILVCVDHFTNWVEAAPMKTMTALEVTKTFFKIIISRHGCPENVISDSGTQFVSEAMLSMCNSFKINKLESSAYHQQANGKTEKFIEFLKKALALTTPTDSLEKWDQMIDHCLFVYRTTVSRVLDDIPFYFLYGRDARLPQDNVFGVSQQARRETSATRNENYQLKLHNRLQAAYGKLIERKKNEQDKYKKYYDASHKKINFQISDKVLVLFDVASKGPLMPRWEGPFTVIENLDDVIYRVENDHKIITVHVNRLALFRERH